MKNVTVSRDQAREIIKAADAIGRLLKQPPTAPQSAPVMYAIMSNLATIHMNASGIPSTSSN